jgi:hypothetical protein
MGEATLRFLEEAKRWVRYGYFLRFALALWLFAPLACVLDTTAFKTVTSGVMTPETLQQYSCVAFFLVCAGFVALICARVVLINGPERWDRCYDEKADGSQKNDGRPAGLKSLLANDEARNEWLALLLSQLPNVGVFWYLIVNGSGQEVHATDIWLGLIFGSVLAVLVWWEVNAFYYLTYSAPDPTGMVEFGRNAARTLLLPRNFLGFGLSRPGIDKYSPDTIEGASTWRQGRIVDNTLRWIAERVYATPGYAYRIKPAPSEPQTLQPLTPDPQAPTTPPPSLVAPLSPPTRLYEGHVFGGVSAFMFSVQYCLMWPLTAPVPALYTSILFLFLLLLICAALAWILANTPGHPRWRAGLIVAVTLLFLSVVSLYFLSSAERFPILATLLIIATTLCWTLSGIAFFLDLYRVPVITVFLLAMILPRIFHWDMGHEEHYLSAFTGPQIQQGQALPAVPEPRQLLDAALAANPDNSGPLIIVTAMGGGLHASAWTTEILAHLEQQFDQQYPNAMGTFHKHLLLASTVSGGSIGLLNYLAALHQKAPDESLNYQSMLAAAQCSSLEAVGWGLVYWDMSKAIVPIIPFFWIPSSGLDDLDPTPLGKDRSWSLRKSFARNANNDYCKETWRRDNGPYFTTVHEWLSDNLRSRLATNLNDEERNQALERQLTLRNLKPAWGDRPIPAFTMNTTSFEDGQRFLLANYRIPDPQNPPNANWPDSRPNYKARSFLATYPQAKLSSGESVLADLPLATAAQMSATFPFISSAARVPWALDNSVQAHHFVDGGYYDNDGTASVIEFLRYALANCQDPKEQINQDACEEQGISRPPSLPAHPVRILLIEIRNSGGDYGSEGESDPYHTQAKAANNLFSQLTAPLLGFWQAGHQSVTARNRAGLAQLEHAFAGRLELHRVVFDDRHSTNEVGTDPLSWSLTPKQRHEVRDSADPASKVPSSLAPRYQEALDWFAMTPQQWMTDPKHHHYADSNWPE